MQYTQQDLFARLTELEGQKLLITDDIKQLKKDFTFNKKENPNGLPREVVGLVGKASVIHAKNVYEEERDSKLAVFDKYEELTGY